MIPTKLDALELDLNAVLASRGARRRGKNVRFLCPSHADHNPSADYNPVARVWVCRVCHEGGGILDLARRLGLDAPPRARSSGRRPRPRVPIPPPGLAWADWVPAWLEVVERARRESRRLAPYRRATLAAEWCLRPRFQVVADARRLVSTLGDTEEAWDLARRAARVATLAAAMEWELDAGARRVA
jgi:hypothetical protein